MGIEYNWIDASANELAKHFDYSDWQLIETAVEALQKSAGIYLDPYGDTRLYSNHARILADEIDENLCKQSLNISTLCDVLRKSCETERVLLFVGD